MKPKTQPAEMNEGPKAFAAFKNAVKKILAVSKNDLPPDPFSKPKLKKIKPAAAKG